MPRPNSEQYVEKMEKAMEEVFRAVNALGYDQECEEGLYRALTGTHRTLQQSFIRALHGALRRYGSTPYYDARNEASVKWAYEATKNDHYFPLV